MSRITKDLLLLLSNGVFIVFALLVSNFRQPLTKINQDSFRKKKLFGLYFQSRTMVRVMCEMKKGRTGEVREEVCFRDSAYLMIINLLINCQM